jgi:hypothetical protein
MIGANIREWVRDSPAHGAPIVPSLRGVWTIGEDGLWYVCRTCLGRLTGRGVSLPRVEHVWVGAAEPIGVCAGCE